MTLTQGHGCGIDKQKFAFAKFSLKISDVLFSTLYISGMVGPTDVKQKGGASVGYWVNYVTLTFDLTCDLDLWFFKVKFKIAVSEELLSDWCETKRKQIN